MALWPALLYRRWSAALAARMLWSGSSTIIGWGSWSRYAASACARAGKWFVDTGVERFDSGCGMVARWPARVGVLIVRLHDQP
jgi:hypothetical protein